MPFGLTLEAVAGRPVTPRFEGTLGATPGFDGAAALWGVRAGYANPGKFTASVAWMERWGRGIPGQRVLSTEALWMPSGRVDVRGSAVVDGASGDLVQGRLEALVMLGRRSDVTAGWAHADVARLIPRWSILSVFAGPVYDEFFLGGAWRPTRGVSVGLEGALRLLDVPGRAQGSYGPTLASRFDARLRVAPSNNGLQGLVHVSRRDDGETALTVLRVVGSFPLHARLDGMLEASAALDGDDPAAPRSAFYGRATLRPTSAARGASAEPSTRRGPSRCPSCAAPSTSRGSRRRRGALMPRVLLRVLLALALAAVACGRRTVLTDDDIRFPTGRTCARRGLSHLSQRRRFRWGRRRRGGRGD